MEREGPIDKRYYKPQEPLPRYPLELTGEGHVCLWSEDGKFKWTIAYFTSDNEGAYVEFVGERPFDSRVDWKHFEELLRHGQLLADSKFLRDRDGD